MHFFAVVLHDGNVRLPETSELHVLLRKFYMWSWSRFSLPLIFNLVAASISHFLMHRRSFLTWWPLAFLIFSCTAAIKFSCYSSNEIGLLCFFISGSSSFFVIHANKDIKINSKERIGFVVVVFYLKKSGWLYDVPPNARVLEMQNFTPAYLNGWTYVGTIWSEPKSLGCIDYQIFLPMVLRY